MATYTDNYQLTKPLYSETADVAAINNNMDKIDDIMHASQVSLAPAYDQNETYNTGDVVMYEFLMYECLEENVTGVWDATKWQRTTAGEHGGGGTASDVEYDNTDSGMTATNVQDAIDELQGEIEDIPSVEANPQGEATEELTKIGIGNTIYEIIGGETIYGKASGAIAHFDDGSANPLEEFVIGIEPVQAGTGDPSPSNPRAISGWTGANISVKGKNIIKISADNEVRVNGNPSRTYEDNGCTINVSVVGAYYVIWEVLKITSDMVGTSFTWSASLSLNGSVRFVYADDWSGSISDLTATTITITSALVGKKLGLRFYNSSGSSQSIKNVMVEVGTTASSFEPYSSNSIVIPISWQTEVGTVYGGELDVKRGVGIIDRIGTVFDGTETWEQITTGGVIRYKTNKAPAYPIKQYIGLGAYDISMSSIFPSQAAYESVSLNDNCLVWYQSTNNIFIRCDSISTVSDFEDLLENSNLLLVGTLVTPIEFEIDPETISSSFGTNNIWSDTGDCEVEYIRDINKAFNILWDAVMNQSNTRSLSLTKSVNNIEESEKEETEKEIKKEGNDENQR